MAAVSAGPKAPRWNSTARIGCARTPSADRRRQGQQQRQLDAAVLRRRPRRRRRRPHLARQRRQDRGADRDADDAERQLVQPVGVIEIRDRAARQQRGERGRDQQVELSDAGAEHARPHDRAGCASPPASAAARGSRSATPGPRAGRPSARGIARAPAPVSAQARTRPSCQPKCAIISKRGDQEQVQQDRRRRGGGEAVDRVQQPALQRHQRDEQQIGKGDAGQVDGERELAGLGAEARARSRASPPA